MKPSLSIVYAGAAIALLLLSGCYTPPPKTLPLPPPVNNAPLVYEPAPQPPKGLIPAETPSVKVAILLPLAGDSASTGNAMLDAATMAISDSYLTTPSDRIHSQIILIPKDTGQTAADTKANAQEAIDMGAKIIVGPLFSQSVQAVAPLAKAAHIPMITFSNNSAVADEGVYLFGFLPEQQVARIAEYAYLHNLQRIALLAPNDAYGEKVKTQIVENYRQKGGTVAPTELYAPSPANIEAAVMRLSQAYLAVPEAHRFQAIYIAEGGNQLKYIIDALKKSKIDLRKIKLLGTGLWDDPAVAQIPEMDGAWFASSPPQPYQIFEKRFVATYGYKPIRLASLAYDAVTLVSVLSMATPGTGIAPEAFTNPGGYISPANGLFRLTPKGLIERNLAILEIDKGQFKVVDPALTHF